jgi:hypothetical protein
MGRRTRLYSCSTARTLLDASSFTCATGGRGGSGRGRARAPRSPERSGTPRGVGRAHAHPHARAQGPRGKPDGPRSSRQPDGARLVQLRLDRLQLGQHRGDGVLLPHGVLLQPLLQFRALRISHSAPPPAAPGPVCTRWGALVCQFSDIIALKKRIVQQSARLARSHRGMEARGSAPSCSPRCGGAQRPCRPAACPARQLGSSRGDGVAALARYGAGGEGRRDSTDGFPSFGPGPLDWQQRQQRQQQQPAAGSADDGPRGGGLRPQPDDPFASFRSFQRAAALQAQAEGSGGGPRRLMPILSKGAPWQAVANFWAGARCTIAPCSGLHPTFLHTPLLHPCTPAPLLHPCTPAPAPLHCTAQGAPRSPCGQGACTCRPRTCRC